MSQTFFRLIGRRHDPLEFVDGASDQISGIAYLTPDETSVD
jgi:hypothetical protein